MPLMKPFLLKPCLVDRIWGTDDLGGWYPKPEPGHLVGEVWLTAEDCTIAGSTATLADEAERIPDALGNRDGEGFPLLLKLLYPRQWLSVQVHPNDAQAAAYGEPRGKTECWYVLDAEAGARVVLGFEGAPSSAEVAEAIAAGELEKKMRYLPVSKGDMVFVEANTVHAIGPGMVVFEVQQYSDVTYRLYDYGRPRELHLKDGLAVLRNDTHAGLTAPKPHTGFTRLLACDYFSVDRFQCGPDASASLAHGSTLQILVPLGHGCTLSYAGGGSMALAAGAAAILPAGLGDAHIASDTPCDLLRVLEGPSGHPAAN